MTENDWESGTLQNDWRNDWDPGFLHCIACRPGRAHGEARAARVGAAHGRHIHACVRIWEEEPREIEREIEKERVAIARIVSFCLASEPPPYSRASME